MDQITGVDISRVNSTAFGFPPHFAWSQCGKERQRVSLSSGRSANNPQCTQSLWYEREMSWHSEWAYSCPTLPDQRRALGDCVCMPSTTPWGKTHTANILKRERERLNAVGDTQTNLPCTLVPITHLQCDVRRNELLLQLVQYRIRH